MQEQTRPSTENTVSPAETPSVSVMIPMQNCEAVLPELFQMMFLQTLQDFELICVVDGATDNTADLVKEYAERDARVKYIPGKYGGSEAAGNIGLAQAAGRYVIRINADHIYRESMLMEMVSAAEKHQADLVMCRFEQYDLETASFRSCFSFDETAFPHRKRVNPGKVKEIYGKICADPFNKLYRRSFLEENHLRYIEPAACHDDCFLLAVIAVAKRVVGLHKNFIITLRVPGTVPAVSAPGQQTGDFLAAYSQLYQWLKARQRHQRLRNAYCESFGSAFVRAASSEPCQELIEGTVRALNEEAPWSEMNAENAFRLLDRSLNLKELQRQIRLLERNHRHKSPNAENEAALKEKKNLLQVYRAVERLSRSRYGRRFRPGALRRLVRKVKKLLKSVKEKRKTEEMP